MAVIELIEKSTRKQKRAIKRGIYPAEIQRQTLTVDPNIQPLTSQQTYAISCWNKSQNLILHGKAGTGKTFLAVLLAMKEYERSDSIEKIFIVRSAVPTRDVGFYPGNLKDKTGVYEDPYMGICSKIFDKYDAYQILKSKQIIEFKSTSHLRGLTFENCIIIVDECQNMNFHELDTIMTRLGDNSRIIFSGDFKQTDLQKDVERKGFSNFLGCLKDMSLFSFVEFGINDIVRSDLVKQYLIVKEKRGL